MGKMIPQQTLHREIHSKIHDIPTPNGKECKMAYEAICRLEREGLIDIQNDSIEKRINILLRLWGHKCPATCAVLKWQREVVSKFFAKHIPNPRE